MKKKRALFGILTVFGITLIGLLVCVGLYYGGYISFSKEDPKDATQAIANIGATEDGAAEASGEEKTSGEEKESDMTIEVTLPTEPTTFPCVQELVLSEEQIRLYLDETMTLEYTYLPEDAVVVNDLLWTSSDETIATVVNGVVTALSAGKATITLQLDGCESFCEVTVLVPLSQIAFEFPELSCNVGEACAQPVLAIPDTVLELPEITWTSDNEEVATVSKDGMVTAVNAGDAVITANACGKFTDSYVVHVKKPIKTACLNTEAVSMVRGGTTQLYVGYEPVDTTDDRTITWTSSNPDIVSVKHGILTAHNIGYAIIYASIADYEMSCEVSVSAPIDHLVINYPNLNLKIGAQAALGIGIVPADTTDDTTLTWRSSDPSVASVDGMGIVTAVGVGSADIIGHIAGHEITSHVVVNVPLESLVFDRYVLDMVKGQTDRLQVGFYPENTTSSKQVSWAISDPKVLSVTKDGLITAVGGGTAVVGATVDGITLNCLVNVTSPLEAIGIVGGNFTIEAGRSHALSLVYQPNDTTVDRTASWTSSNPSVANVDAAGVVRGVAEGTAVITATVAGVSTTCEVTVIPMVEGPRVTLVFDPGHGGPFVGSTATHYGIVYNEKDQNLKVALYTKAYLEAHYEGVTIHMTRSGDSSLSTDINQDLQLRCQLGQQVGAAAVISFHFNGVNHHTAVGSTILCSSQPHVRAACDGLGASIQAQLTALGIYNRGLAHTLNPDGSDYYAINRYSAALGLPGIIIEHCFMDNIAEWKFFGSDEALQRLAAADAIGIANYYGLKEK